MAKQDFFASWGKVQVCQRDGSSDNSKTLFEVFNICVGGVVCCCIMSGY